MPTGTPLHEFIPPFPGLFRVDGFGSTSAFAAVPALHLIFHPFRPLARLAVWHILSLSYQQVVRVNSDMLRRRERDVAQALDV